MSVGGVVYSNSGTLPLTLTSTQYLTTDIITGVKMRIDNSGTNEIAFQIRVEPSCSVSIDWVKLELGSIATPFSPRPYAEELAMCQRYYQKITSSNVSSFAGFSGNAGTQAYITIPSPTLRTSPTITVTGNGYLRTVDSGSVTPTTITINSIDNNVIVLNVYATITGSRPVVLGQFSGSFDAEIY